MSLYPGDSPCTAKSGLSATSFLSLTPFACFYHGGPHRDSNLFIYCLCRDGIRYTERLELHLVHLSYKALNYFVPNNLRTQE